MRNLFTSKARLAATVAVLLVCLSAAQPVQAQDQALYQKTLQATAFIDVPNLGRGTGWVVDREQKLLITNKHVVGTKTEVTVYFPLFENGEVVTRLSAYLEQSQTLAIKGKVLYRDEKRDLALIRLDRLPQDVQALRLAKTGAVKDDTILAIGNSSLVAPPGQEQLWKVRTGKVSGKGFIKVLYTNSGDQIEASMITELPGCKPGDSGGPLVNGQGELVGVTSGSANDGKIGLAIDLLEVRTFLDRALNKIPTQPNTAPVAGTWTVTIKTSNGQTAVAGLTLRTDGTCTFEAAKEATGTYSYVNGRLTLNLPGLVNETVNVTWIGEDRFEFPSGGASVSLIRR
jgi:S1-C subfamily serine protease